MAFYVGCYLILQDSIDLKHDSDSWELPDTSGHAGHMADTANIEELLIKPEDMDRIPTQIQFGTTEWTDAGFSPDHEAYAQFYVRDESFYARGFTPVDYWTPQWYAGRPQFYTGQVVNLPGLWTPMFYPTGSFYAQGAPRIIPSMWTTDPQFYPVPEFYVRSFTPVDFWTEFYVRC